MVREREKGWVRRGWGQQGVCNNHIGDCSVDPGAGVAQCGQSGAAPQAELH